MNFTWRGDVCAHFERHRSPSKEGKNPITYVRGEPFESEDLRGALRVDCVEEAGDVEKQKGACVSGEAGGLDAMDQGGGGVDGVVMWS